MNTQTIIRLLTNADFHVLGADGEFIYIEDPSCILRSFTTFVEYAWIIIAFITGILLFGWAISMIRGAKNDIFTNMRNLILIFGILSVAIPTINLIYGDDLFARGCRTITVSINDINKLLDMRNARLQTRNENDLYEEFEIYDSGTQYDAPYNESPAPRAGEPGDISVSVSPDANTAFGPNGSNDVIYVTPDGTQYRRTGGSRAWRNNNPGNIRMSPFIQRQGAIGVAGNFAVFPDEETGMRALHALLRSSIYNRLTIADAISKYAPPHDNNDVAAYRAGLRRQTGLDITRTVGSLNDQELGQMARAIRNIEGWRPGRIIPHNTEAAQ